MLCHVPCGILVPSACMLSHFSYVQLFATPWTVVLSVGFSRQEYWSELPCLPPGDLPDPGIKRASLTSPALAGRFFFFFFYHQRYLGSSQSRDQAQALGSDSRVLTTVCSGNSLRNVLFWGIWRQIIHMYSIMFCNCHLILFFLNSIAEISTK